MNHRQLDRQLEDARAASEVAAARLLESAQEVAERAGAYLQARMTRVSEQAQTLAHEASGRVEDLTGRPVEAWAREAERCVRSHPLGALAVAVGIGYVLGKLLSARS